MKRQHRLVGASLAVFAVALLGCGGLLGPRTAEHAVCGSSLPPPTVPGVPSAPTTTSPGLFVDAGLTCFERPSGLSCTGLHGKEMVDWKISHPRDLDEYCALDADGAVKCVGTWFTGRPAPAGTFTTLHAEGSVGCALDAAGTATCFGYGPEEAPEGPLVDVVSAFGAACGLHPDGTIGCSGYDDDGCFDDPPPGSWSSIAADSGVACAIDGGGNVACWGRTEYMTPLPTKAKLLALDDTNWCAVGPDDTLACGGSTWKSLTVPDGRFRHVDVAGSLACAVRDTGEPVCFGRDPDDTLPWWRPEVPSGWVALEGANWSAALPSAPELYTTDAGRWTITTWAAYGPDGEEYAVNEVVPTPDVTWTTPEELLAALRPTHEATLGSIFAGGSWVASELVRQGPALRYGISFQRRDGEWRKSIQHLHALADRLVIVSFTGKPTLDATPLLRAFDATP